MLKTPHGFAVGRFSVSKKGAPRLYSRRCVFAEGENTGGGMPPPYGCDKGA